MKLDIIERTIKEDMHKRGWSFVKKIDEANRDACEWLFSADDGETRVVGVTGLEMLINSTPMAARNLAHGAVDRVFAA